MRIKLLRSLRMPLEDIRALQLSEKTLSDTLRMHLQRLTEEKELLSAAENVCRTMQTDCADYTTLNAHKYLEQLENEPPSQQTTRPSIPSTDTASYPAYPWRRFFARSLDYSLYLFPMELFYLLVLRLNPNTLEGWYIQLFKPSSFVPVLAVIGIVLFLFIKNPKHKDTGLILLGFATLMTGMDAMSDSVSGLKDVPAFTNILTLFSNPVLGVLAGTLLTAIIQSSSASVGILQALSATGAVTFGSAVPIIMGQNIGTCVTALISSVGTSKTAKIAARIHLYFNVGGTVALLSVFYLLKILFFKDSLDTMEIDSWGIAFVHTVFNVLCTVIWFPFVHLLEKLTHSEASR